MADISLHDVTKRYPDGTEAVKEMLRRFGAKHID